VAGGDSKDCVVTLVERKTGLVLVKLDVMKPLIRPFKKISRFQNLNFKTFSPLYN
jgi:hypothetical protein